MEDALHRVCDSTSMPVATGERYIFPRRVWRRHRCGGSRSHSPTCHTQVAFRRFRRIATLAETYDVALAPHCPLGPIALAACLQVDFVSSNALIQEQSHRNSLQTLGLTYSTTWSTPRPYAFTMGTSSAGRASDLGIEGRRWPPCREPPRSVHRWRNPLFFRDDGSLAEW